MRREQDDSLLLEVDMRVLDRLDELSQFDALLEKVVGEIGDLMKREDKLGDEEIRLGKCSQAEMQILRYAEKWIQALRVKAEIAHA